MSDDAASVVVVTGMSGAGKSTALRALEDIGYFCVDNLPTPVLTQTLVACAVGGKSNVALGLDVRGRSFLEGVNEALDALAAEAADFDVIFLDAADDALLRRFSTTRRPHPLGTVPSGPASSQRPAVAVLDGIEMEREELADLRARATEIIDTTDLSVHDLRRRVIGLFDARGAVKTRMRILSFGFKYGPPVDADIILDVRFLPNPYFIEELREIPGTEAPVRDYVLAQPDTKEFLDRALPLLEFCLPRYQREGRAYVTIAIGCTGGRHRSVALAEWLSSALKERLGTSLEVVHRDLSRDSLPAGGRS